MSLIVALVVVAGFGIVLFWFMVGTRPLPDPDELPEVLDARDDLPRRGALDDEGEPVPGSRAVRRRHGQP